jgi:DNA processing protein
MSTPPEHAFDLLRLTLVPGLGPVIIRRLLERFGSAAGVFAAPLNMLEQVEGVGGRRARAILDHADNDRDARRELERAGELGVSILTLASPGYPSLLAQTPDAPPVLYLRGALAPEDADRYALAIVGSRECSAYGVEQAERFAGVLARSGLTIVSGGARGIDAAAHRGALHASGRTIVVQGCGLAHCYPPEHEPLYTRIIDEGRGAILSELPLDTAPAAVNFPRRNRVISGLALGVLLVEAGERSGALITARIAAEEHGREVMALPGRVDSPASRGALNLIKDGGALLVTEPADVLSILESPARHHHDGTFEHRYPAHESSHLPPPDRPSALPLSSTQRTILDALAEPLSPDRLVEVTGLSPAQLRAELTMLELQKRVRRSGGLIEATHNM